MVRKGGKEGRGWVERMMCRWMDGWMDGQQGIR